MGGWFSARSPRRVERRASGGEGGAGSWSLDELVEAALSRLSRFEGAVLDGSLETLLRSIRGGLLDAANRAEGLERRRLLYYAERVRLLELYALSLRQRLAAGRRRGVARAREDFEEELLSIRAFIRVIGNKS